MKKLKYVLTFSTFLVFISCEKDEIPVAPFDRGEIKKVEIALGENYEQQVWFDLLSGSIVKQRDRFLWDIAFPTDTSAKHLRLNGACVVQVAISDEINLQNIQNTSGLRFLADPAEGFVENLIVQNWQNTKKSFVFDLGFTPDGRSRGIYKAQFKLLTSELIEINFARINSNSIQTITFPLNAKNGYLGFSFSNKNTLETAPGKNTFDLLFTNYTHIFSEPYMPYSVTGVLLNQPNVKALKVDTPFESITAKTFDQLELVYNADAIGYDWKSFDLNTSTFNIDVNVCYLIIDREGFKYKLRFLDFYSKDGKKGYPSFEYEQL